MAQWPCNAGALKAYEKALELSRKLERTAATSESALANGPGAAAAEAVARGPSLKLLNNAAVVYLRLGNLPTALSLMEEASTVRRTAAPPPATSPAADRVLRGSSCATALPGTRGYGSPFRPGTVARAAS